jgi:hypothetical protein
VTTQVDTETHDITEQDGQRRHEADIGVEDGVATAVVQH